MKKTMMAAVAAATVALGCAPVVQADDDLYLQVIQEQYFYKLHTDAEWLQIGHDVCDAHLRGDDDDQLTSMLEADGLPDTAAGSVIGAAEVGMGC